MNNKDWNYDHRGRGPLKITNFYNYLDFSAAANDNLDFYYTKAFFTQE